MIGKIVGAFVGGQLAKQSRNLGGPAGAALGFLAPTLLRRMSLPGMIALAAGGYAAKKYAGKGRSGTRRF
ncbi:hypothetical protein EYB45_09445 [Erythrobacteraceae bacterium CFH 75059]|uniref:hypothetical protein n=1 Tax=Qipengyuania thermophila TaxID=2509361 RepID=UPI001020B62F|nr:hypothetical protein [Qipengyuania thermophila]TCD04126.1 hypothetical protein EYB45_09445 [Erythrobacteraceae bacterium CFH 75059]